MNRATLATRKKWQGILRQQAGSGLSVAAFCGQERVPVSSFYAWKRRLAGAAAPSGAFVEARVSPAGPASGLPAAAAAIEVRLRGGRGLRVRRPFDPQLLRDLVGTLEALP